MSRPDGLINSRVGSYLAKQAATVPEYEAIVEIGCYKGLSTSYLARGATAGRGATVYAVDPWDLPGNETGRFGFADPSTREAFHDRLERWGLTECVVPIQAFSTEAASSWNGPPIGLLFIDGDHREQAVLDDWCAWRGYLATKAMVVFDDYVSETGRSPGVERAVSRLGEPYEVVEERLAVIRL